MRLIVLILIAHQILVNAEVKLNGDTLANGINGFCLEFTKKLDYKEENILFSPLGLAISIGMIWNGADAEMKNSLSSMLNIGQFANKDDIHNLFKSILSEYKGMATRNQNPRNATVELSNLIAYADKYNPSQAFIDALKNYYEANVAKEDFVKNGEQIKEKLNKFVSERTHGLIPQVFTEPLKPDTIMVLLNTIFFKGYWQNVFNMPTNKQTFYNADKSEALVDMMSLRPTSFNYAKSTKHNAAIVELPYKGSISMIVILPDDKSGLSSMLQNMDKEELESLVESMNSHDVAVSLPKFTYDYNINLIAAFNKMGVNIVSALTSLDKALLISSATHKAKIQVHEAGTEAAAVTSFEIHRIRPAPPPLPPKIFKADHPFVFFIRDIKSKVNLFAGVVNQLK